MNLYTYDNLELNGRLGNQLWQIATTICRAEENEGVARLKPDWEYRPYFSVPDFLFGSQDHEEWDAVVDGGTEYFQEYSNFEPIDDLIRLYFKPSMDARAELNKVVLPETDEFCAVHLRRGDYLKHPKHFPVLSSRYFTTAIQNVRDRNPEMGFMVFSDDMQWCKGHPEHFGFTSDDVVVWHEGIARPVEVVERIGEPQDQWDLFTMTLASEHVISNSTFSWWGAFLSGNLSPMYPDRWFGPPVPNWERWELAMPSTWRKFKC